VSALFGRRLAELRNHKGMSQYELADRLQLSRGQIANYEQGTREPDFQTLIRLADFFRSQPRLYAEQDRYAEQLAVDRRNSPFERVRSGIFAGDADSFSQI